MSLVGGTVGGSPLPQNMPHPLPDDVNTVTGLKWFLVAIPDDEAFTRTGWDVYTELANYWKWGKEGPVPQESDKAAQLWASAVYETIEAYKMGFPDLLLNDIDEIKGLLRGLRQEQVCCEWVPGGDQVLGGDEGDLDDSDTNIGGGVFPPGIETEPAMRSYLCGAATALVDRLIITPSRVMTYASWSLAGLTIILLWFTGGALLAVAGIAIGAIITLPNALIALDILESIRVLVGDAEEPGPSVVEAELTAARDDLICAIVNANNHSQAGAALRGAIADAVTSTAWTNVLFLFTSDSVLARVFNGESGAGEGDCPSCPANLGIARQNLGRGVLTTNIYSSPAVVTSQFFDGHHRAYVSFGLDTDPVTPADMIIDDITTSVGIVRADDASATWKVYEASNAYAGTTSVENPGPGEYRGIEANNTGSAFTLTVHWHQP